MLPLVAAALGACDKPEVPASPEPPPPVVAQTPPAPEPEPWQMRGTLLGVSGDRAIVLADQIVSVEIASGEVRATAVTRAQDPAPSFDRLLPRLGEPSGRKTIAVDRRVDAPIWVGAGAVVFVRGTPDAVTSLVGLDPSTLETAWTVELAYEGDVRGCATAAGVLLLPSAPDPVRFIAWDGAQRWLRELGGPDEEIVEFACGDEQIAAHLKGARAARLRIFDAATGDLVRESAEPPTVLQAVVERATVSDPRARQLGELVEGRQ